MKRVYNLVQLTVISIDRNLITLRNYTRQIINVNYKTTRDPRLALGVHQMLLSANQKSLPVQLPSVVGFLDNPYTIQEVVLPHRTDLTFL